MGKSPSQREDDDVEKFSVSLQALERLSYTPRQY